jgi:hypothetical protein
MSSTSGSGTAARIEEKVDTLAEALATFVQHQLTLVAHQPPFDRETALLGRKRFEAFVDLVGRRRASGTPSLPTTPQPEKAE